MKTSRARNAAIALAIALALLPTVVGGVARGAPLDWYNWVGGALGPYADGTNNTDGRPDTAFNGSTDALDYRNWKAPTGWATNMSSVTTTIGSRWGFTSSGGFSEVGGTGSSTWFTGAPSASYPGVAGGTPVLNPALATIGSGQTLAFPVNTAGAIGGDMTVHVNGGTFSSGAINDNGYYAAWLPPYNNYTSGYMWPNKIIVSNSGSFTATTVNGFQQGGGRAAGNITLEVRNAATVNITTAYTAGHTISAYGATVGSSAAYDSIGRGGGGLTLKGSGGTITIPTVNLLPSATRASREAAGDFFNYYNGGAVLKVVLDSSVAHRTFNTVQATTLEIDPARDALNSPVDVQVVLDGYAAKVGDVIPLITATTIQKYNGALLTGSLGDLAVNGTASTWSASDGGGKEIAFSAGGWPMKLLDHDPANVGNVGLYLQVGVAVPEPATVGLLAAAGALAGLCWFRRRR